MLTPTDYWETVEVEARDKHGKVLCDADGKPVMRKVAIGRRRLIS
jgi:hypothetical protein